jgi:hypothetical protein
MLSATTLNTILSVQMLSKRILHHRLDLPTFGLGEFTN